jgi:hypothetical protein
MTTALENIAPGQIVSLAPGDIIEVNYRLWRPSGNGGEHVVERWIAAQITSCEAGTHPLARLADGQVTEIRSFMRWRLVAVAPARNGMAAAA